ncbi:hypothetical protein FKP32DRAFT_1580175 [Trametes sanguinea]|nr:hypothetical protein FKP32DRAFT_1580175 [Trametes sanguinea]
MGQNNLATLTKSHNIVAAKKKAKREQIKEIVFDDDARREFLTGFHKRKLAKKEEAKRKAKEREKQERLEARREHRRMLAEQAAKNAEEAERAYGGIVGKSPTETQSPRKILNVCADVDSDDEWDGLSDSSKGKGRAREEQEEYEDEEQLATVTVVEEFDPDSLIHGDQPPPKPTLDDDVTSEPDAKPHAKTKSASASESKLRPDAAKAKTKMKTAKKAKDIKYQTNAARKAERMKQRKRKVEKAERAGGKASRKKGGVKSRR